MTKLVSQVEGQVLNPATLNQTMMMMNPNMHFRNGLPPQINQHQHLPNNGFGINGGMGLVAPGQTHQQTVVPMLWQPAGTFPQPGTSTMPGSLSVDYTNPPTPMATISATNILPPSASLHHQLHQPTMIPISDTTTSTTVPKKSGTKSSTTKGGCKGKSGGKQVKQTNNATETEVCSSGNPEVKEQHCRERNREHARSTRLRKKAYIQKLKDMAHGLRAVQNEEIRRRRVSMHKMLEVQKVRRSVIQTVLHYHAVNERDPNKWNVLLEESFWLKQPVTPFRSFRRSEVERDCRIIRGTDAMICDAASLAVMVHRIGCHTSRWKRIKRGDFPDEDFLNKEITIGGQPPESSLSSDSDSSSSSNCNSQKNVGKRTAFTMESQTTLSDSEGNNESDANNRSEGDAKQGKAVESISSKRRKTNQTQPIDVSSRPMSQAPIPIHSVTSTSRYSSHHHNQAIASLGNQPVQPRTSAYYCVNEDDMITIEDVMMCPYVFRTTNGVLSGALADCVIPGMLRAHFSPTNKLLSMEMVFDAMGFMQQLDGANGGDITAQVIPGCLEMALLPVQHEARVITEAKPPYNILHVNETWTRLTNYTQLEVEGKPFLPLLSGHRINTDGNLEAEPAMMMESNTTQTHNLDEVSHGRSAFSTSIHYRKYGKPFVDFMCSYPLTNASDEITHLLHVNVELPNQLALIS